MKSNLSKPLQSYLAKYGQAIDLLDFPVGLTWQHVLILPVCGESTDCMSSIFKDHTESSVLVIVILNRPDEHVKSGHWRSQNKAFKKTMVKHYPKQTIINKNHLLLSQGVWPDVLLLDFNGTAFSPKEGVGLARRIAADTACALIDAGSIENQWFFSTDADVQLPPDYFSVVENSQGAAALSLKFEHVSQNKAMMANQERYDFKLRYYQKGVRFIGAAYDYIPLGSTLVVHATAYAKVRGFPRRSGGEDFYLLNKLAKVGRIHEPLEPVIPIKVRQSDRVPFGTGPALAKIQQQIDAGQVISYYHPEIFVRLKKWRQDLLYFIHQKLLPVDEDLNDYWHIESVLEKASKQIHSKARWQQFIHEWFDAFRILKSVHFLMATHASVEFEDLIELSAYDLIVSH